MITICRISKASTGNQINNKALFLDTSPVNVTNNSHLKAIQDAMFSFDNNKVSVRKTPTMVTLKSGEKFKIYYVNDFITRYGNGEIQFLQCKLHTHYAGRNDIQLVEINTRAVKICYKLK